MALYWLHKINCFCSKNKWWCLYLHL